MKKTLSLILTLLMLAVPLAGHAEPAEAGGAPERIVIDYDYEHLVVGNATPFNGSFFTGMWGALTSDLDVQRLIHGYNLVEWRTDRGGAYNIDPTVVSGIVVTQNQAGDRTFTFDIYSDLLYSDGTQITAWDYAFSWLLSMAPQMAELGANVRPMEYLKGYQDYVSGKTAYLAGIHVSDENTIAITIDAAYLPFFYEMALLDCYPVPIRVIAPGCRVADDGNGVYIANADANAAAPLFTADLLRRTVLDAQTGYRSHPSVTSGPYILTAFDGQTAELALNPYYKGNSDGVKPVIPRLTYRTVGNAEMAEAFRTGRVGLLNKVVSPAVLRELVPLVGSQDTFAMTSYARSGLSYIAYCCERPAVSSQAVRQAIAMCVDKDGFVADTVGDYGLRADGWYGIGQWMYTLVTSADNYPIQPPEDGADAAAQQAYEASLQEWAKLTMDGVRRYDLNTAGAAALLASDGWTLNRDGGSYDPARDDVRCKRIDGALVPLELKLLCPAESGVAAQLEKNVAAHLAEAGIRLTVEEQPVNELLRSFYRQQDRDCDMIYIASNFGIVFDPSGSFRPDTETAVNRSNYTAISDPELYQRAVAMRETEPGDLLGYCRKWIAFQERFQEVEPMIPLYSGVYFDFYPRILQNYDISATATWGEAIVEAYMSDVMQP